jgi:glycine cleavage system transcriptional repressor
MPEYAVTAIGRDRPGIVAAISRSLLELDGNIEDSQMSILRGHFAVMLIVGVPDGTSEEALAASLGAVRDELELEAVTFKGVDELAGPAARASHVITVYGADHPGIVSAVSSVLADNGTNITDLETRLAGSEETPLYVMLIEVSLGDADAAQLDEALQRTGEESQVEISLRELEADPL